MRPIRASHARTAAPRGFTLIELLVVVSIIAVLIGLLLPALGGTRRQANKAHCLSHQGQLATATALFANDNDGRAPATGNQSPPGANWLSNPSTAAFTSADAQAGQLWVYLLNLHVYRCPDDLGPWPPQQVQNVSTYVMNGCFSDFDPSPGTNFKLASFRGDAVVFWENPPLAAGIIGDDPTNNPPDGIAAWHDRGTTIACLDGHAEVLSVAQFSAECNQRGPNRLWCDPVQGDGGIAEWISDENDGQPIPAVVFSQP